jgi:hypothetical protein
VVDELLLLHQEQCVLPDLPQLEVSHSLFLRASKSTLPELSILRLEDLWTRTLVERD